MNTSGRHLLCATVMIVAMGWMLHPLPRAQTTTWTPPKTPWGHPDLQGIYTNKDETNTPLERPDQFAGRSAKDFTAADLAALAKQRQAVAAKIAGGIGGAETGAGPTHWYEHLQGNGSRPWLIIDPPDGKLPPMTPQALKREAAAAALNDARNGEGRADSWLDRSLYDRCITRGLPGSMMPAIYGNAYDITQAPGIVAIRYEMIHETRIIRLDSTPRTRLRSHMGEARGHFEGDTLVVETTGFDPRSAYRNGSPTMKLMFECSRSRSRARYVVRRCSFTAPMPPHAAPLGVSKYVASPSCTQLGMRTCRGKRPVLPAI